MSRRRIRRRQRDDRLCGERKVRCDERFVAADAGRALQARPAPWPDGPHRTLGTGGTRRPLRTGGTRRPLRTGGTRRPLRTGGTRRPLRTGGAPPAPAARCHPWPWQGLQALQVLPDLSRLSRLPILLRLPVQLRLPDLSRLPDPRGRRVPSDL